MILTAATDLDNALVGQKDQLLARINSATNPDDIAAAFAFLDFAAPVWVAGGYGYKVEEVRTRIRDRADHLARVEWEFMTGIPTRSRLRRTLSRQRVQQFDNLAGNANAR